MALVAGRIDFWMKAEILFKAMMTSEDLKVEMVAYQMRYPSSLGEDQGEERYNALKDILHRTVTREREEENRLDREAHDRRYVQKFTKPHPTAPAAAKGSGKKGKGADRSKSRKGKGDKKGKDRSQSRTGKGNRKGKGGQGGAEEKGLCVNWVVGGSCAHGASCRYKHEKAKNDADEKYYHDLHIRIASRSKSPAPKGKGKGVCRQWQESGKCKFGDQCKYSHDNVAAPAPKAKRTRSRARSKPRTTKGTSAAAPVTSARGAFGPSGTGLHS